MKEACKEKAERETARHVMRTIYRGLCKGKMMIFFFYFFFSFPYYYYFENKNNQTNEFDLKFWGCNKIGKN